MKTASRKTVYELSVEDLQHVASEVLERELTNEEIAVVGNVVGDYIDWFQAIENAIHRCVRAGEAVLKFSSGKHTIMCCPLDTATCTARIRRPLFN